VVSLERVDEGRPIDIIFAHEELHELGSDHHTEVAAFVSFDVFYELLKIGKNYLHGCYSKKLT